MNTPKKTFQQSNRVKTTQTKSRYATVDGETGIQRDKTTGEYVVRLLCGTDRNGKQVRKFERFSTLKEARKCKEEFKAQKKLKQTPPPLEKITLGAYMEQYLERHKQEIEETTSEYYEKIYRRIKKYKLFKMYIQDIEKNDISEYVKELKETTTLKAQTINKDLGFLRTLFDNAQMDDYTLKNPARQIKNLKIESPFVADCYTIDEAQKILRCLDTYSNRNVKLLYYFGMCLGLRRGEIMGLKWESVDFQKNTITIENTRVALQKKVIEKAPKSKNSKRVLSIAVYSKIIEALQDYKQWQQQKFPESLYVMINPQTGKPLNLRGLTNALNTFRNKYEIRKVRIHDLRHTYASIAIAGGANINAVSNALGHCDTRITENIYIHQLNPTANEGANKAFASIFDEKPEK